MTIAALKVAVMMSAIIELKGALFPMRDLQPTSELWTTVGLMNAGIMTTGRLNLNGSLKTLELIQPSGKLTMSRKLSGGLFPKSTTD